MTLKQQIEATIQAYEEACKPKNLNINYCVNYNIESGICLFAKFKEFKELEITIFRENFLLICQTPIDLNLKSKYKMLELKDFLYDLKNPTILDCHQTRLQYLRNLLNTLPNDSDN